jgi:hypothetical protein
MNQTTKRKALSGRAVLTRTTRKDKHRKYRPISEMRNALKLNQKYFGLIKMVWLVQNCRSIKCLQFLKPPELRREGAFPPWAPTRALPTTSWRTLSGPSPTHAPPLTTNPGSAPGDCDRSVVFIRYSIFLLR